MADNMDQKASILQMPRTLWEEITKSGFITGESFRDARSFGSLTTAVSGLQPLLIKQTEEFQSSKKN